MSNSVRTAPMEASIADRLLDLLSSDDAFRARFQQSPRDALEAIGYQSPAPAKMTACGAVPLPLPEALVDCRVNELATKEAISAARSEILAMLTSGLAQTAPQLDTGIATPRQIRE